MWCSWLAYLAMNWRLVVWAYWGMGGPVSSQILGNENIVELDTVMATQHCESTKCHWSVHVKMVNLCSVYFITIKKQNPNNWCIGRCIFTTLHCNYIFPPDMYPYHEVCPSIWMPICTSALKKYLGVPFCSILSSPRNIWFIHIPVLNWIKYYITCTST